MKILLSNDDGVQAAGLWALHDALAPHAELCGRPEREQSASSRRLTLHQPLRVRSVRERVYAVEGTPTDCILMAVRGFGGLIDFQPDLVVSDQPAGRTWGMSPTPAVAAAFEGHLLGFPAVALSASSRTTMAQRRPGRPPTAFASSTLAVGPEPPPQRELPPSTTRRCGAFASRASANASTKT
ncbi:MAG: 5'/3'-nucleotidase SurE [Candidatus Eisenbacteria bacterium]